MPIITPGLICLYRKILAKFNTPLGKFNQMLLYVEAQWSTNVFLLSFLYDFPQTVSDLRVSHGAEYATDLLVQ